MTDVSNPQDASDEGYAQLMTNMAVGLMTFGDNNLDMADGALSHLLLHMANEVVAAVNSHPYRTGDPAIEFYKHPSDRRPIADRIMSIGIAAFYAAQQGSEKANRLLAQFYQTLNSQLYYEKFGNSKIEVEIIDKRG